MDLLGTPSHVPLMTVVDRIVHRLVHDFLKINVRVHELEQKKLAEYCIAVGVIIALLNIIFLLVSVVLGVFVDLQPRLFGGILNTCIVLFALTSKKPRLYLRGAAVLAYSIQFYRAFSALHEGNYALFVSIYFQACSAVPIIAVLFVSTAEVVFLILFPIPLTMILRVTYVHVPADVFQNAQFSIIVVNFAMSVYALVVHAQTSALRRQKEEVQRARVLAEDLAHIRSQFLAAMSHEVRTPLNGIIGLTAVLLDGALHTGQREMLEARARTVCILSFSLL